MKKYLSRAELEEIKKDPKLRRKYAEQSIFYFVHFYFSNYVKYMTPDFHREIYRLLENDSIRHLSIVAYRGAGKSTLVSLIYALWAILGQQQKKYVFLVSLNQDLAQRLLGNIREHIEQSELFRKDFGPLEKLADEWGSMSLVLKQYGARISAASPEQKIRGTRHREHRPDLVICDDVEDSATVKTKEGRDKTANWYFSEVLLLGDPQTKFVLIGNLLHRDSLMMRMKAHTEQQDLRRFVFKEYPIMRDDKVLWPAMFPTNQSLEEYKATFPDELTWYRECMLIILPDSTRLVNQKDVHYYDEIPNYSGRGFLQASGIDPATSEKDGAAFTAIVSVEKHGYGTDAKLYVYPHPVNKRQDVNASIDDCRSLALKYPGMEFYVEDVGMQRNLVTMLTTEKLRAEPAPIRGRDKHERLALVSHWIKNGTIQFPSKGCEELITQIVDYGIEKYADQLDAFTLVILHIMENKNEPPEPPATFRIGPPPRALRRRMMEINRSLGY